MPQSFGHFEQRSNSLGTYEAFVPDLLADLDLSLAPLIGKLSRADKALGRLDGVTRTLSTPELFTKMFIRKEAILSTQIEGTRASLNDLLESTEETSEIHSKDLKEVTNYIESIEWAISKLDELPISRRMIQSLHEIVVRDVRGQNMGAGKFRTSQNYIAPPGSEDIEEAFFVPPPPEYVEDLIGDLEAFANQNVSYPVLLRVGLIHQQFEVIHPFLDGNGRVGRALIPLLLMDAGELQFPILYLSRYFRQHQQGYYRALRDIHEKQSLTPWLSFFFDSVADVAKDATETATNIRNLQKEHRELVDDQLGHLGGTHKLLTSLFETPVVTVNHVEELLDTSYQNANKLVKKFEDLGILSEITGQKRNRKFRYDPYLEFFGALEPDEFS